VSGNEQKPELTLEAAREAIRAQKLTCSLVENWKNGELMGGKLQDVSLVK
jgi:hypothetical protein